MKALLLIIIAASLFTGSLLTAAESHPESNAPPVSTRHESEINFNQEWTFYRPESTKVQTIPTSAKWETVSLPHSIRLEPRNANGSRHYLGHAWYRKNFVADAQWKGKRVHLRFEGAMQVAEISLNGTPIATHWGGYLPFTIDLTDRLACGQTNVRNRGRVYYGIPREAGWMS